MSEVEKIQRQEYKQLRRKRILLQAIALAVAILIAVGSFHIYNQMSQTYYIHYTENGEADYTVQLHENTFYEQEQLDSSRAYISSLIDKVTADFAYTMDMAAANVAFDYSYGIDARLVITDKLSDQVIFDPVYELVPVKTENIAKGDAITIHEQVTLDYAAYDSLAREFIDVYQLKEVTGTLAVTLHVEVLSQCASFESSNENAYSITLNIPLAQNTITMETSASAPNGESKVLACSGASAQMLFKVLAIVAAVVAVILAGVLIAFIYLTRNDDINYTIKVKKLVSSYRSYIQQIKNEFDTAGYQVLQVKTFPELLGIRDTLQSPILMSENADQTRTQFIIPTSTQLLYLYEVKVDNYDKLYNHAEHAQVL